jgi:alkylation response protein AidB-like acyl-CoA dehydrogenase
MRRADSCSKLRGFSTTVMPVAGGKHRQAGAAEAGFEACDWALQTHGGFGYAKEFDVERLWREIRLYKIAPVSQQMALNYIGEHVLGLPKSY